MSRRDAYVAIADPTRRRILVLLRDRGTLLAGEIASHFASASRPAISRHLRVLRQCGVVNSRREGKARKYSLEPAPLCEIRDAWLADFGGMQVKSLRALRELAEPRARRSRRTSGSRKAASRPRGR